MFRIAMSTLVFVICTGGAAAPVLAQQMPPPPEGPPQAGNPYGQPYGSGPAAAAAPNPQMLAKAKRWFSELQSGTVDRSQLASDANANMNAATIANAQKMIGGYGKPASFVQQQAGTQNGMSYAIYLVTFQNGQRVDFLFATDQSGKVTSLGLGTPH